MSGIRASLVRALADDASEVGMTYAELMAATGVKDTATSAAISNLRTSGRIFIAGVHQYRRYYGSAERMEACRPAYEAWVASVKKAAREARREKQREKAAKRPKAPKRHIQRPMVVRQAKAAPVHVKAAGPQTASWLDQEPIHPPHVKVQHIPSGVDSRYTVDPASVPRVPIREWARKPFAEA